MKVSENSSCTGCPLAAAHPDRIFSAPKMGGLRLSVVAAPKDGQHRPQWTYAKSGVDSKEVSIVGCINCAPASTCCAKLDSCKHKSFPTEAKSRKWISEHDAAAAVSHCAKQHLLPMLKARPWERIDLLGEQPLKRLGEKSSVDKWRGSPIVVPQFDPTKLIAIATLDSTEVMKDQTMIPVVLGDLRKSLIPPPEAYKLYPSLTDVQNFKSTTFTFDIEVPDWKAHKLAGTVAPITIVGLTDAQGKCLVVPFRGAYIPELKRIFANAKEAIGQNNLSYDIPRLAKDDIVLSPDAIVWDTMLMHHLCFPDLPHDLEFIGSQFSSKPAWKHDKDLFELYCARDCDITFQAWVVLKKLLLKHDLESLYHTVQVPMAKICRLMEDEGVKRDPAKLLELREKLLAKIADLEPRLPDALRTFEKAKTKRIAAPAGTLSPKTGKPVKWIQEPTTETVTPWRSDAVKKKYLYGELGLPEQFHPKTKKLTINKDALDRLSRRTSDTQIRTMLGVLKEINKAASLLGTFVKESAEGESAILHPHFSVVGTATGRLSSSGEMGNFQNQPELVRYMYVPKKTGWRWASIDYSQIENRLMAFLAQDKVRLDKFGNDATYSEHKYAASLFMGVPYDEVEKDKDKDSPYARAKAIVHAGDRLVGAARIAANYDMDLDTVKHDQVIWKTAIAATGKYQTEIIARVKKQGWLRNPFGRMGFFYTESAATQAVSFMPQSTAFDVIARALTGLMYERIGWPLEMAQRVTPLCKPLPRPANLLLQVHDEGDFEYPAEMEDEVIGTIKEVFEQPWPELGGYSIPVGIATGESWGEAS